MKLFQKTVGVKALVIGALSVAALALVNTAVSRSTEKRHPPQADFMTVKGVRLHYSDRGQGNPIVLIHGNAVTGDDWNISGVSNLLLKSHRVIIFDRPGCGYSERPHGRAWTADQQAELLHQAVQQLGITSPIIVGHSLGATIALAYAARYQSETAAVVLLSGYYFWTLRPDVALTVPTALPLLGDLLRYTVSPLFNWLQTPLLTRLMFAPAAISARFRQHYVPAMISRPSQIRATAVDGALMIEAVIKLRPKYQQLKLPIAMIAGDGDYIVFPHHAHRLHAEIGHSTIKIIKGAGHMVHYFATEDVVQTIKDMVVSRALPLARPA